MSQLATIRQRLLTIADTRNQLAVEVDGLIDAERRGNQPISPDSFPTHVLADLDVALDRIEQAGEALANATDPAQLS